MSGAASTSLMRAAEAAPCFMTEGRVFSVIPPMATIGTVTADAALLRVLSPTGGAASAFVFVLNIGPNDM